MYALSFAQTFDKQTFNGQVTLVDSACETAREVKEMLMARRISIEEVRHGREQFFVTDSPESFAAIAEGFWKTSGRRLHSAFTAD